MAFALPPDREKELDEILTHYPEKRAACLPALWLCQRGKRLGLPRRDRLRRRQARSHDGPGQRRRHFLHDVLRRAGRRPTSSGSAGRFHVTFEAAKPIQDHLEKKLRLPPRATRARTGSFTLLKAECLAACGQAPMVQINDFYYENLDVELLDRIIEAHAEKGSDAAAAEFATFASYGVRTAPRLLRRRPRLRRLRRKPFDWTSQPPPAAEPSNPGGDES